MWAGANEPVEGGSTSENHGMPDVWPRRNRLAGHWFPLARRSSKLAKSLVGREQILLTRAYQGRRIRSDRLGIPGMSGQEKIIGQCEVRHTYPRKTSTNCRRR